MMPIQLSMGATSAEASLHVRPSVRASVYEGLESGNSLWCRFSW